MFVLKEYTPLIISFFHKKKKIALILKKKHPWALRYSKSTSRKVVCKQRSKV